MIASKSNKALGSKSYDDLLQSKTRDPNRGFLVRKLFRQPPPKLNNQFQEVLVLAFYLAFLLPAYLPASISFIFQKLLHLCCR
jgi:hypothetical protein